MPKETLAQQPADSPPAQTPPADTQPPLAPSAPAEEPQGDIRQNALDLLTSLGYSTKPDKPDKPDKPKEDVPTEPDPVVPAKTEEKPAKPEKAKDGDGKADEDSEYEKSEDKPSKKRKAGVKTRVDTDIIHDIVDRTARSVASEIRRTAIPEQLDGKGQPQDYQPSLAEQRDIEVFTEMAEDPRYKGIDANFRSFLKAKRAYQDKWESAHPDEQFDVEAEEHQAFLDRHLPKYDESDFDDAKVSLRAKQITKAELEKRDKQQAKREAEQTVATKSETTSSFAAKQFVAGINPDLAKAFESQDSFKQFNDANPVAGYFIDQRIGELRAEIGELIKLSQPGLDYRPIQGHPIHDALSRTAIDTEIAIKQLPASQRINQGKEFATLKEYSQMTPEERDRHWILTTDDLVHVLTAKKIADTKATLSRLKLDLSKPASLAPQEDKSKTATQHAPAQPKPAPPTPSASVETLNTPGTATATAKTLTDEIVKSLWS